MKDLERLQSLERLERLQSLESLEGLQSLEISSMSYDQYEYQDGDIVYCDPPYKGTKSYGVDFDHENFWEWVRTRKYPVYVSEYNAPEDFVSVFQKEKTKIMGGGNSNKTGKALEQVFIHRKFLEKNSQNA